MTVFATLADMLARFEESEPVQLADLAGVRVADPNLYVEGSVTIPGVYGPNTGPVSHPRSGLTEA